MTNNRRSGPRIRRRALITTSAIVGTTLLVGDHPADSSDSLLIGRPEVTSTVDTSITVPNPRSTNPPTPSPSASLSSSPTSSTSTPSPQVHVSLPNPGVVHVGEVTTLAGTVTGAARAKVTSQVRLADGTWTTQQAGTVEANGHYQVAVTYRVDQPGTTTWRVGVQVDQRMVWSPTVTLTRRPVSVSIRADETAQVGEDVSVDGTVSGGAKSTVTLQLRKGSAWTTNRTTTANSEGGFSLPLAAAVNQVGKTTWRVVATGRFGRVESKAFTLTRHAVVTLGEPLAKKIGVAINLTGTVAGGPKADVFAQVLVGTQWTTQDKAKADAKGRFTLPASYKPKTVGDFIYRVGATVQGATVYSDRVTVSRLSDAPIAGQLDAIMAPFIATYGSNVGAAITDVTTGGTWSRNGQVAHQMASTLKPLGCAILFAQAKAAGRAITQAEYATMTSAIVNSDNNAMTEIWERLGKTEGFNEWIAKLGITGVRSSSIHWGRTMASASSVNQFMGLLVRGGNSVLPAEGARWIRETMRRSTTRWGVGIIGSSAGRSISVKDGWSPFVALNNRWAINSFGWVSASDRSFTIAITTVGWPTMNAGVSVINDIARQLESAMLSGHID